MELHWNAAVWLLLQFAFFAAGKRTRDNMYDPISGASCFRRLNGTHQTGCSSSQSGSVGVLHLIEIQEHFRLLLENPPAPPYAPMIPPHLFTRENILRLKNEGGKNISVVLLINRNEKMLQFSHELNCPNQYSGIQWLNQSNSESATCDARKPEETWNPWGTGLLHEDFPFPIYYIADIEEIEKLEACYRKFNAPYFKQHAQRSLCAIEVNTFMSAAVSSEVCMRRTNFINNLGRTKYCDPLEGRNIYASLFPRKIVEHVEDDLETPVNPDEKLILVTCRLDTTSMFDGVGLGALDSLMGYATLINAAHMLVKLIPEKSMLTDKRLNVLFVIFNGESYDYIGSQRFVYDLEHLAFPTRSTRTTPISFDNIEFVLDLGTLDDISSIDIHSISAFPTAQTFAEKLQKYGRTDGYNFNITFQQVIGRNMPPTSAQSFLRRNISFPAFVLNAKPQNKYYHSIYDDVENVNFTYANTSRDYTNLMETTEAGKYFASNAVQMKVRNISSVIAMALFDTLTGQTYTNSKIVNPLLVDEFLFCFLQSAACPLFKAASHPNSLPGLPIPPLRYISVAGSPQESSGWTYRLLGYLVSRRMENVNKDNCTYLPLHWCAGYDGKGECRLTTQNYSHALSPAFLIDDYDWKSGNYSTWTESTWSQFSARIFLRPSRVHELVTLSIGIVILVISFLLVYIISSRSDVLFEDAPSSTNALTAPTAC